MSCGNVIHVVRILVDTTSYIHSHYIPLSTLLYPPSTPNTPIQPQHPLIIPNTPQSPLITLHPDPPQVAIPTEGGKKLTPAIKPDEGKEGEAKKEEGGGDGGDGYPTQLAVRTVMMNRRCVCVCTSY